MAGRPSRLKKKKSRNRKKNIFSFVLCSWQIMSKIYKNITSNFLTTKQMELQRVYQMIQYSNNAVEKEKKLGNLIPSPRFALIATS